MWGGADVPEDISSACVGYFPLMASLPLGGAEDRENIRWHENNFCSFRNLQPLFSIHVQYFYEILRCHKNIH